MGGFKSVLTLRLSQPSLAGVGAGAELGNKRYCKVEYVQHNVCFVNVKVVRWLHVMWLLLLPYINKALD